MLRRALAAALLAFPGLLSGVPAGAQPRDPSFRILNNTPNVVNEVYASAASQRSWGHDRLGSEVIAPGQRRIIRLPADGTCVYDIRVVYQGGTAEERRNLDTCALTDVVLGGGASSPQAQAPGRPTAQAQQGNPTFNLQNRGTRVSDQFFASPSSQQHWGPDRLGDEVVQPGAGFAVRLPVGECAYDLRWVYQDGQSQERRNVNTCGIASYEVR